MDFEMQFAQKLYGPMIAGASPQDMASVMALYPMLKPALEKLNHRRERRGRRSAGRIQTTVASAAFANRAIKAAHRKCG